LNSQINTLKKRLPTNEIISFETGLHRLRSLLSYNATGKFNTEEIKKRIEKGNNFSIMFNNNNMPRYSTEWKEYRVDQYMSSEDSGPGREEQMLREYHSYVMNQLIFYLSNMKEEILREIISIIKKDLSKHMNQAVQEIDKLFRTANISTKLHVNNECLISVNSTLRASTPSAGGLYIESKTRHKERLILKGLGTIDYQSFKLTGVSDFREYGKSNVESLIRTCVYEIEKEVNDNISSQVNAFVSRNLEPYINICEQKLAEYMEDKIFIDNELKRLIELSAELNGLKYEIPANFITDVPFCETV
jgi:hypothetical protein